MDRCPCCTARLGEATLCPRCHADLGNAMNAEHAARHWFASAIQHCNNGEIEASLAALDRSLRLKKDKAALVFREFIIEQQCKIILDLLAAKQLLPAIQHLYQVRSLLPYSPQLRQLRSFTDYLAKESQYK